MIQKFDNELSDSLIEAARDLDKVPADATERAQVRLLNRLRSPTLAPRSRTRGWLGAAATVVALVIAIGVLPLFMGSGDAFAAVLERFRNFTTLAMIVTQRFDGKPMQTSHVVVGSSGVTRTDVGTQLSVIVDPVRGRMLTLLHDEREAMVVALPQTHTPPSANLIWLDELRSFTGKATALPGTRVIDGHSARGWSLDVPGSTMEIWADADGLPLTMHMQGNSSLEINYRFTFNEPIAAKLLSTDPPADYQIVAPDEEK